MQDFPSVFDKETEAVIILAVEGETAKICADKHIIIEETILNQFKI